MGAGLQRARKAAAGTRRQSRRSRAIPKANPHPLVVATTAWVAKASSDPRGVDTCQRCGRTGMRIDKDCDCWRCRTLGSSDTTVGAIDFIADRFLPPATVVPAWLITWPQLPPTQNDLMRKFSNKHAYGKLVKCWRDILWAARTTGSIPIAVSTGTRRRLEITRYIRAEEYRLDRGNLVGGCKPLLDAAVQAQLLFDDKEAYLDDHYRQIVSPDERTELLLHAC